MKKLILSLAVLATAFVFTGCKTIPNPDNVYATSYMIGVSTGMVMENIKIDEKARAEVIAAINIAQTVVPNVGQSFEDAWVPVAEEHVAKLVADGKIDGATGTIVKLVFKKVCEGVDYLFDVRYPQYKNYKDIAEAAVHGFTTGLLDTYKQVAPEALASKRKYYDKEAYLFLSRKK